MYDISILFPWGESMCLFLLAVASQSVVIHELGDRVYLFFLPHTNVLRLKQAQLYQPLLWLSLSPDAYCLHINLCWSQPSSFQGTFPPVLVFLCPVEPALLCHGVVCYPMPGQNSWEIILLGLDCSSVCGALFAGIQVNQEWWLAYLDATDWPLDTYPCDSNPLAGQQEAESHQVALKLSEARQREQVKTGTHSLCHQWVWLQVITKWATNETVGQRQLPLSQLLFYSCAILDQTHNTLASCFVFCLPHRCVVETSNNDGNNYPHLMI